MKNTKRGAIQLYTTHTMYSEMRAHDVIHLFTKFRCAHAQCVSAIARTNERIFERLFSALSLCRTKLKTKIPNWWPHLVQLFV